MNKTTGEGYVRVRLRLDECEVVQREWMRYQNERGCLDGRGPLLPAKRTDDRPGRHKDDIRRNAENGVHKILEGWRR